MVSQSPIVDPSVWEAIAGQHWGNEPKHFKRACDPDLFPPEKCIDVLKAARNRLAIGKPFNVSLYDQANVCRTGQDHSSRANSGLEPLLPADTEASMDAYISRLMSTPSYENFTLFVDRPHILSKHLWHTLRSLLSELYNFLPLPRQPVGSDMFCGHYKGTPFGVHQDALHNLMFMSHGTRVMHFYPDAESAKARSKDRRMTCVVEPGDLLYWPPDYWHIGESSGAPATSVNVDLWEGAGKPWETAAIADAISEVSSAMADLLLIKRTENSGQTLFNDAVLNPTLGAARLKEVADQVVPNLADQLLEQKLAEAWALYLSTGGLNKPAPLEIDTEVERGVHYRLFRSHSLLRLDAGSRCILACNGHILNNPANEDWEVLVTTINTGAAFTVDGLIQKTSSGASKAITEFLDLLVASRCVVPVDFG